MSLVASSTTLHEAWNQITHFYANKSCSQIMHIWERLTLHSKDTNNIVEYMQVIKKVVDELAIVGDPLSDDDLTIHVLNVLKSEYEEVVSSVRARESPITFEELYDKLEDHEIDLKWGEAKQKAIQTFTTQNIQQTHHVFPTQNAQLHINIRTNSSNKNGLDPNRPHRLQQ